MAITKKPRRCFHRFVEGGWFCIAPGCGVPRAYVEAAAKQPPPPAEEFPDVQKPTEGFDY